MIPSHHQVFDYSRDDDDDDDDGDRLPCVPSLAPIPSTSMDSEQLGKGGIEIHWAASGLDGPSGAQQPNTTVSFAVVAPTTG